MPSSSVMTILPLSVTIIGAAFSIVLLNHYFSTRRRPHELIWAVAFLLFAIGAACQVFADVSGGWSDPTARLYYLTGAILNVGFLGLGTMFLSFPRRVANIGLIVMLLITAVSIYVIFTVPVDAASLHQQAGWKAVASLSTAPRWLAAITNSLGTLLVVGGALWSGFVFWRKRIMKNRMIGVFLLAAGTFIVALGGSVTGIKGVANANSLIEFFLYLSMAVGVCVMFIGYLQTIRPATAPQPTAAQPVPAPNKSSTVR